jgi:hypothetical protein
MTLKADLPDHIYWLTETVEKLVRPAAFLLSEKKTMAARGDTRHWGPADLPADAAWAKESDALSSYQSYCDGPAFAFQLNLAQIPEEVRQAGWPVQGIVWVFIDVSGSWRAWTQFDPRAAADIPWTPREATQYPVTAHSWFIQESLTCATQATLPEIADDYHGGVGMAVDYDEWWQKHYGGRRPSDFQLGGWILPIQGDCDESRKTLVCALERQAFGDSGAVYLHYSQERGFFAEVYTC